MAGRKFEASDKKVQKMSREGLTEENLHSGERQHVSTRTRDIAPERIRDDGATVQYGLNKNPYDTDVSPGSKRKQRTLHRASETAAEEAKQFELFTIEEPSGRAAHSVEGNCTEVFPDAEEGTTKPEEQKRSKRKQQTRKMSEETADKATDSKSDFLLQQQGEMERTSLEFGCQETTETDDSDVTVQTDHSDGEQKLASQSARMAGVRERSAGGAAVQTAVETRHNRSKKQVQDFQRNASVSHEVEGIDAAMDAAETDSQTVMSQESEKSARDSAFRTGSTRQELRDSPLDDRSEVENQIRPSRKNQRNRQPQETQQDAVSLSDSGSSQAPSRLSENMIPEEKDLSDFREEITRKSKRERLNREQRKAKSAAKLSGQTEGIVEKAGRLSFDDESDSMVRGAGMGIGRKAVAGAAAVAAGYAHTKLHEAEQDNSAIEGAHQAELLTENSVRKVSGKATAHKTGSKSQRQVKQEAEAVKKAGRLRFSVEEEAEKTANAAGKEAVREAAEKKRAVKHFWQKKQYKEAYTAAKQGKTTAREAAKATTTVTVKFREKAKAIARNSKGLLVSLGVLMLLMVMVAAGLSSCAAVFEGVQNSFVSTTYVSTDDDIYAVENAYSDLETALDAQINNMESTHPGYDEYNYQIDEISHNPYQLISYLTVLYGEFTYSQVSPELQTLFAQQYSLTVEEKIEIRTRTETRTGTTTTTDPETGETTEEEYEYEVEVEYEYKILNITLVNHGLDTTVRSNMTSDEVSLYTLYNSTYGNRSYLFDTSTLSTYTGSSGFGYEVSAEALTDEKFARMIAEAEKYLGYPYVWGGSSPSTSFDCSGFVCWVINNCGNGWNVGRTTADGLRAYCSYVSPEDAQPGDLIFFQGTYNTSGASHVGIYVGNGMMIHCGSPIQYTSIETSYWQSHLLAFGRLQ
ncbi:MAG: NlpC/P60 family protein [Lachnospiraceae bacterium]|nr:NlpC/P60 family protein [Lachnospiraceae bacterium]